MTDDKRAEREAARARAKAERDKPENHIKPGDKGDRVAEDAELEKEPE